MKKQSLGLRRKFMEEKDMRSYVLGFDEIDKTKIAVAGGKGANLGELSGIEGLHVPDGFCITTTAFKTIVGSSSSINKLLDHLSVLKVTHREKIAALGREIRGAIEAIAIPAEVNEEITRRFSKLGETNAYAIRSSATAEDLPTASFAGQQDSFLNVIGKDAIMTHIARCWASLFTERAIIYRIQNGFDHRKVQLAVVVQKMIFPDVAGILFTADPITCNRKISSIDASFGLGEALVSGVVNADVYKVRDGSIIQKKISTKKVAIFSAKDGGTREQVIDAGRQNIQALGDEQVVALERLGRKIEKHFGSPQDIEWCLTEDGSDNYRIHIVQSRPITTLFPVPEVNDEENRVYVSVGHQQMMTDAMKPLGLSLWQLTAARPMHSAGGRLFVDITAELASPTKRHMIVNVLGNSDLLLKDALTTIISRDDFIKPLPDDNSSKSSQRHSPANFQALADYDPAIVSELIRTSQGMIEDVTRNIQTKSGTDLFDFILEDIQKLKKSLADPKSFGVIMTAMNFIMDQ